MPRPRKPDHLKLISGTDQPCRMGETPTLGELLETIPQPPDWLPNAHAGKEWQRLAPILVANKRLTEVSLSAFGHVCALHGKLVQIWAAGETPTAHLLAQYKALIDAFGIPPMAAGKLKPASHGAKQNRFREESASE